MTDIKIYDLNVDSIIRDKTNFKTIYNLEKEFIMNNSWLALKCKEYLKNNNKENIFIKYNNKFYKFKKSSIETENAADFCIDCNFKKECHEKLKICICEALFKEDTEINLKEIEEYEIIFSGDENENI